MSRYQFMPNHDQRFDLAEMSEALGVSRRGYYRWAEAKPSARREQDELIKPVIEQVVRLAHGPYGYRPVPQHLREQGVDCGRDHTLRLMRELDLVGRGFLALPFVVIGHDSSLDLDTKSLFQGYSEKLRYNRK